MTTLPAAAYLNDAARTNAEMKQALEDIRQFIEDRMGTDSSILARSKNALINGNFDLWQRGTSVTTTSGGAYLADRWRHELVGASGSITVSRQAFTIGQTDVPGEPTYYYRANQTAAPATGTTAAEQRIEGVRSFAGQSITVSFYGDADAAQTFTIEVAQNFGTGGSPSSEVTLTSQQSLTTSWALYEATFTLASISGKTLGSNGDDYLGIRIVDDAGTNATFTLDIASFQVEAGSGRTPFDKRAPGEEYDLAARYYVKSYDPDVAPGTTPDTIGCAAYIAQLSGVNAFQARLAFPVRMRTNPTITLYNTSAANANWRNITGVADSAAGSAQFIGAAGFGINNAQVSGDNAGDTLAIHWTAEAEL